MRAVRFALPPLLLVCTAWMVASAQEAATFPENLSMGSSGAEVMALQRALNKDPDTRVAETGPGSPGNETNYFGPLTKAAVVRFQEKYAGDILKPAGFAQGNGYVGSYTRAKLNALSSGTASAASASAPTATTPATTPAHSAIADYTVKDNEKIDIYVGDKMIANVRKKVFNIVDSAVNASIASLSAAQIKVPTAALREIPSVSIRTPSPRSAIPGTYVSLTGTGMAANSVVYIGSTYIVRTVSKGIGNTIIFVVPPIPPGRYDVAVKTGGIVSNTVPFVVTDPKNPNVHLQSVSPASIKYGDPLTITGSGFSPQNNMVVTTYQTITGVASADGTTLTARVSPDNLRTQAKVGNGTIVVPMSLYVVSDYGFSDSEKSFTMTL